MVRVIATDLDGTLLTPRKKFTLVAKENKDYLKDFYGDVVLVSGRNPRFCAKICNCLKIHHNFVALNGALIVKNGNVIYRQSMKKTGLVAMLEFLKAYYTNFELLIFDKYDRIVCYSPLKKRKIKSKHFRHLLKHGRLHEKIIVNNNLALKLLNNNVDIHKAIIYGDHCDDMYNLVRKEFNEHFEFFPSHHSIEVSPIGVSKGDALNYLIETTKVKKDEVFVIGDNANDLSMFEKFKNSFVMDTAENYIKAKAKHTIHKFTDLSKYTTLNNNFKED